MRTTLLSLGALFLTGSLAAACGTESSEFDENLNGASSGTSGNQNSSGTPPIGSNGNNGDGGSSGNGDWDPDKCASNILAGRLLPVDLALVFDVSGSMCAVRDDNNQFVGFLCEDNRARWPAATSALDTFFRSPDSEGLSVAVRTYGPVDSHTPNTVANNRCNPQQYETFTQAFTPLPSATLAEWVQAPATRPDVSHGDATMTQTGAALRGATTAARAHLVNIENERKVSILLLSDGDPTGCGGNPTGHTPEDRTLAVEAAAEANSGDNPVQVYVINIGGRADILNAIAAAGGTGTAINITDPTDPAQIQAALEKIRGEVVSCTFKVPEPETGTPDPNKLNIQWTPGGGEPGPVLRSQDCSDPTGWRYDDPTNPNSVTLCPERCQEVTGDPLGKIDIILGCQTADSPVN